MYLTPAKMTPSRSCSSQEVLTLGLCLEYETFIRGVFCPNLCVCVFVCVFVCLSAFFLKKEIIAGGPLGPPAIFSDNKVQTINIIIHFQIKLKNFLGPKILSLNGKYHNKLGFTFAITPSREEFLNVTLIPLMRTEHSSMHPSLIRSRRLPASLAILHSKRSFTRSSDSRHPSSHDYQENKCCW